MENENNKKKTAMKIIIVLILVVLIVLILYMYNRVNTNQVADTVDTATTENVEATNEEENVLIAETTEEVDEPWEWQHNTMVKLIREAIQIGCNFFDTAVVYGEENEKILGEAIKPYRDDVVIATKFGILGQSHDSNKPINELDSRPETIRKQLEESLKRLQVDCIDVYYQHRVDPNKIKNDHI